MRRKRVWTTGLLAGALLAGCDGSNLFFSEPIGSGGGARGSIRGFVASEGLGVPGAGVSLQDSTTATTDGAGVYRLEGLTPAAYRLFLRVPPGYELVPGDSAVRTATVIAGQTTIVNWQLLRNAGAF